MHEMAICESILQTLQQEAAVQGFSVVRKVRLEIGPFSGVEIDALRFGFDVVTKGSLAADATLEVLETKGTAWCLPCAASITIKNRYDPCPTCNSHQLQITGGEELRIKELEVD